MPDLMWTLIAAFASSIAVCNLIVRSARWHLWFSGDPPGIQPQKVHTVPVPRIGGVAVLLGLAVAGFLMPLPASDITIYWWILVAALPAFLGGFLEDALFRVGPVPRLLLTLATGAVAFSLAGVTFVRSDVAWLDQAMAFLPTAYCMLLFAVAGVAHSINIIDGSHGLAGGVSLIILLALGHVAQGEGDLLVSQLCFVAAAATFGFLLLNYPSGRLFLGDGGAYLLGSVIALAGVLLVQRNPGVSPWFPMALVIYPVWETLFTVARRTVIDRTRVGDADVRHLHSLVHRRLSPRWVPGESAQSRNRRNGLTALPFWGVCIVIAVAAVYGSGSTPALGLLIAGFIVAYTLAYRELVRPEVPRGEVADALEPAPEADASLK